MSSIKPSDMRPTEGQDLRVLLSLWPADTVAVDRDGDEWRISGASVEMRYKEGYTHGEWQPGYSQPCHGPFRIKQAAPAPVEAPKRMNLINGDRQFRKDRPIARGALAYFPDALAEVANVSRVANEQHNPGQPMHWAFGKSMDHADCIIRHLSDVDLSFLSLEFEDAVAAMKEAGEDGIDEDGLPHVAKVAWRGLALLQTWLEVRSPELHARRQAQRDAAAKGK